MKNEKGFTLLELLVVVLIIGILASIALPQYRRAVTKSKAAQMYEAVSSMAKSAQMFYMVNGFWPSTFSQLDIDYDVANVTNSVCNSDFQNGGIKRNNDFELLIGTSSSFNQIAVRFSSGPYKCTGFNMFFKYSTYPNLENKLLCYEKPAGSATRGSKNQKGDFCEKVMGYSFYMTNGGDANFFIR